MHTLFKVNFLKTKILQDNFGTYWLPLQKNWIIYLQIRLASVSVDFMCKRGVFCFFWLFLLICKKKKIPCKIVFLFSEWIKSPRLNKKEKKEITPQTHLVTLWKRKLWWKYIIEFTPLQTRLTSAYMQKWSCFFCTKMFLLIHK